MRREWSGWIKARQWGEFEKLAKSDPSQPLADTIAELELGFPDKKDRRALRKVLFLLAQAGFVPNDIVDSSFAEAEETPSPTSAFMISADGSGDTVVTYSREQRGRVGWLIAHFNYREGITRAIEDTLSIDEYHVRLARMHKLQPHPSVCVQVPPEFVLGKLASLLDRTKTLPSVIAYWRTALSSVTPQPHPATLLKRPSEPVPDLYEAISKLEATRSWRLELGVVARILDEFNAQYANTPPELLQTEGWWVHAMAPFRNQIFTPQVIEQHRDLLWDTAYLLSLAGDESSELVMALADELESKGAQSAYAIAMTSRTFLTLVDTLTERAAERTKSTGGTPAKSST